MRQAKSQSMGLRIVYLRIFLGRRSICSSYIKRFTQKILVPRTKQSLYTSKQVQIPKSELYVIYTGERQERLAEISLSKEFLTVGNLLLMQT